jgi:signal transduction histidine kinase
MANWVAAIADNVKNPIAGITAVLDLAEARLDDPAAVLASIAQIRARLAGLDEYVTELAGFARPAELRLEWIAVDALIAAAIASAKLPGACAVEVSAPAAHEIFVDGPKLERALSALIRNAFEAVDTDRPPRLGVTATGTPGGLMLAVEDNGRGMPPDVESLATEPFYTTKEAGTGLGLTVARKYAEAHGGRLEIDGSAAFGGSRVALHIPDLRRLTRSNS